MQKAAKLSCFSAQLLSDPERAHETSKPDSAVSPLSICFNTVPGIQLSIPQVCDFSDARKTSQWEYQHGVNR